MKAESIPLKQESCLQHHFICKTFWRITFYARKHKNIFVVFFPVG